MTTFYDFATALRDRVAAELSVDVKLSFTTRVEREEMAARTDSFYCVPTTDGIAVDLVTRHNSEHNFTVDLAVFRPVTSGDDLAEIAAGLAALDRIIALWDADETNPAVGALRRERIAGALFRGMEVVAWSADYMQRNVYAGRARVTYSTNR